MKFTVDRSKWWRGHSAVTSSLLRSDGNMCCLGFMAKACGATDSQILHKGDPLSAQTVDWPDGIGSAKGRINSDTIMSINDRVDLEEWDRESRLDRQFKSLGIDVEFVGEGRPE